MIYTRQSEALTARAIQATIRAEAEAARLTEAETETAPATDTDCPSDVPAFVAPWMRGQFRASRERFVLLCRAEEKAVEF